MFTNKEKEILLDLICSKQTHMLIKNPKSYESAKYKELESLKIKIKNNGNIKALILDLSENKEFQKIIQNMTTLRGQLKIDNEGLEV